MSQLFYCSQTLVHVSEIQLGIPATFAALQLPRLGNHGWDGDEAYIRSLKLSVISTWSLTSIFFMNHGFNRSILGKLGEFLNWSFFGDLGGEYLDPKPPFKVSKNRRVGCYNLPRSTECQWKVGGFFSPTHFRKNMAQVQNGNLSSPIFWGENKKYLSCHHLA